MSLSYFIIWISSCFLSLLFVLSGPPEIEIIFFSFLLIQFFLLPKRHAPIDLTAICHRKAQHVMAPDLRTAQLSAAPSPAWGPRQSADAAPHASIGSESIHRNCKWRAPPLKAVRTVQDSWVLFKNVLTSNSAKCSVKFHKGWQMVIRELPSQASSVSSRRARLQQRRVKSMTLGPPHLRPFGPGGEMTQGRLFF